MGKGRSYEGLLSGRWREWTFRHGSVHRLYFEFARQLAWVV